MGRSSNFYYQQSPLEAVGQSLGTALFGDPAAAALQRKQQSEALLRDAQTQRELAAAGYDTSRTTGQDFQNTNARGLAPAIAQMLARQNPPPAAMPSDPLAALSEAPAPGQLDPAALGNIISLIAGAQGDKVDMGETMGSIGAFLGDDSMARRGMVAQGQSPSKDFAITPQRADEVAGIANAADLRQALGVATINNRDDIPVANIQAETTRRGQDVGATTARRGQDIRATTATIGKQTGFSLVSDVLPGARMTSGERSVEHNREVDGAPNSYHLPGDGVETYDIAPMPGESFESAKAKMKAKYGARLVEALDESHRPGHGAHWHFAVQAPPKTAKGKAGAVPKGISKSSLGMIDTAIDDQIKERGAQVPPRVRTAVKSLAIKNFQRTGDPISAVRDALDTAKTSAANNRAKAAQPSGKGARRVGSVQEAMALPVGTRYVRPDGVEMVR